MQKPNDCLPCPLGRKIQTKEGLITLGRSFSNKEGAPKFGVSFVGEALGNHEAQEGLPFRPNGESGSLITQIIEKLKVEENGKTRNLSRSDFEWDNIIKCQPPNNELVGKSYEQEATECCRIYNNRSFGSSCSIGDGRYHKVIVALGGVAFRELTGVQGKKRGIEDVRGYVFNGTSDYNCLVVPSLHPSFIRHGNSRFTSALIYDVKKALAVANGSYNSFYNHASYQSPSFVREGKLQALVSLYYKLRSNPQLPIYYDIENPYTAKGEEEEDKGELEEDAETDNGQESGYEITSIQFAYSKDWAICVPWEKPFIKIANAILALSNDKIGANVWHHDNPRLEANGAKINGKIHDLMWAWHHMQPGLWKGLQRIGSFFDVPFDWKYKGLSELEEDKDTYGCMDVIAPAYIWPSLVSKMKASGVWESYLRFKLEYRAKVLKPAELRGFFVDKNEHKEFEGYLKEEVKKEDEQLQRSVPESLRNIRPSRTKNEFQLSYGYLKEPPIIRELRAGYEATRARMLERGIQPQLIMPFEKWAGSRTGLVFREFERFRESDNQEFDFSATDWRWCRVEPFKASSQQLIKYLKFKGYKVPVTLKTNKETTGKKELQGLWEETNDSLLGSVIRLRSYNKMLSNDLPNWLPDKDGVVRTTFLFDPPNWQLNSRNPNIQNASKHPKEWELIGRTAGELQLIGQRFRKIVKAPAGRCVVEFDKQAFHVSMMGFEAKDPLYIKWAPHMHTAFCSYIVGEPIDIGGEVDLDKINYIKKKYKNIRDGQAKPTVLGNQLGIGETKLFYMNKTFIDGEGRRQVGIESKKRAKYLQDMLKGLFPKEDDWKKRIVEEAHYKTYLKSHYGALRWFYDVMRWDYKSRCLKRSQEAEQATSHPIQADAFGHIHSILLRMADSGDMLERYWFANTIHDSLIFFPLWEERERCIEEVYREMVKADLVLRDSVCAPDGLVVGVDVMCSANGGNWASYHKELNPLGIQEVKI